MGHPKHRHKAGRTSGWHDAGCVDLDALFARLTSPWCGIVLRWCKFSRPSIMETLADHFSQQKNVSSAYDTITNLLGKMEEFTQRLRVYSEVEIGLDLKRIVIEVLTTLLMIFAWSEKLIERGRWSMCFPSLYSVPFHHNHVYFLCFVRKLCCACVQECLLFDFSYHSCQHLRYLNTSFLLRCNDRRINA